MSEVTLVAAKVREVFTAPGHSEIYNVEVGETVTPGACLCWNATNQMVLADGNSDELDEPWAIALQDGTVGQVISVLKKGHVAGFVVAGLNTGVRITLSDTPGVMEDNGLGECCGRVVALPGATTADYVIHFDVGGCIAGIS